jgi:hypothetical protein
MDLNRLSNDALKAYQTAHPELAPANTPRRTITICHDYDQQRNTPMTTPATPATPAEQFRADMMQALEAMRADLSAMRADLDAMRAGLMQASQPAPKPEDQTTMIIAVTKIEREKRKGTYYYRMLGGMYTKH